MNPPEVKERPPLEPGTVLDDRFEILSLLGKGKFGEVYRARQLVLGQSFRHVALKLFAEGSVTALNFHEALHDAIIVIGLLDEQPSQEIASRLIQIYDMGIIRAPTSRAFMSMKLIPGKNLRSEVYRYRYQGGMPVMLSLRYMREMLLPLAWMHGLELAVVHGDLKPENVMLTADSRLVLVDFGLAAHMPVGARGGDIAYLAPEKWDGGDGDEAADIYSVGVIWYELLTGVHPFAKAGIDELAKGDSEASLRAQLEARQHPIAPLDKNIPEARQKNRIVPASEINRDLAEQHPQIELLLNKCLAYNSSRRHANARVLLDHIHAYLKSGKLLQSDLEVVGLPPEQKGAAEMGGASEAKSVEMRLADATALMSQNKLQAALGIVENILRSSSKMISALVLQVRILAKMRDRLADASASCDLAMKLDPRNPDVYEALADLRQAQGKTSQVEGIRKHAQDLRKSSPRATAKGY